MKKPKKYYINFPDFLTFKINDDYKQILWTEKGHFYPFEEKGSGLEPQEDPLRSCAPGNDCWHVETGISQIYNTLTAKIPTACNWYHSWNIKIGMRLPSYEIVFQHDISTMNSM